MAAELADAKRRTWRFTAAMILTCTLLVWSPLLPGHEQVIGAATAQDGAIVWVLFVASMLAAVFTYRRFGSRSRPYVVAEAVEVFFLYGTTLWMHYVSGFVWSIVCLIQPSNAMFIALVKPGLAWRNATLILASNATLAACYLSRGRLDAALVMIGFGILSAGVCWSTGRRRLRSFEVEAERDFMDAELAALRRERAQRQLAHALDGIVGAELAELAADLARDPAFADEAERARAISAEVAAFASETRGNDEQVAGLARSIAAKCRPLCEGRSYEQVLDGDASARVDAKTATTLLRVAQELVRNAVVHGRPAAVRVEVAHREGVLRLRVRDDGVGLSPETLERASGGLKNAKVRLAEIGGTLELVAGAAPAELLATVPSPSAAGHA